MLVILQVHLFYCSEKRSKIGFSTEPDGSNLPKGDCDSWMHWKSTTISGDISEHSNELEVRDVDVLKGLMNHGYYIGWEDHMNLEFGLY